MRTFRIEREKFLNITLKGIGSSMTEGYRWNSLNKFLVYTSESRALATLEVSVHLDLSEDLPSDRYCVEVDIPDNILILELNINELPDNWESKPPILETQFIGDDFVRENKAAVLKVPSAIIHAEFNYLINPNHPDAKKIKIITKEKLNFDKRFSQKKK